MRGWGKEGGTSVLSKNDYQHGKKKKNPKKTHVRIAVTASTFNVSKVVGNKVTKRVPEKQLLRTT